jgi:heme exporter protein C
VWCKSLHQPPSNTLGLKGGKSAIDPAFLGGLLAATVGFSLLFGAIVMMRMRALLADIQAEARLRRLAQG